MLYCLEISIKVQDTLWKNHLNKSFMILEPQIRRILFKNQFYMCILLGKISQINQKYFPDKIWYFCIVIYFHMIWKKKLYKHFCLQNSHTNTHKVLIREEIINLKGVILFQSHTWIIITHPFTPESTSHFILPIKW